ncbi:MAG TPA: hypothetical protein VK509_25255, partial [Polyangiales bacterium]|nr:hypothetical protein [Polyangiales bacterium]
IGGTGGIGGSGGVSADAGPIAIAQDADCDLNGIWAVQQITVSSALGAPQYKNAWSYQEIEHDGTAFVITKQFDCGGEVKGTIHVTLKDAPTAAMMIHNTQAGRTGTMKKGTNGTCELTLDTFWSVRGANEAMFIPATGRNTVASLAELQAQRPLPTTLAPTGAEDWDMDGYSGLALDASGAVTGTRHSVQRDWSKAFTDSMYTVTPATTWTADLAVRVEGEAEDSVFATQPPDNLLLGAGTVAEATDVNNRLIMRFLGRNASDPRVGALPTAGVDPVADPTSALATCYAIQDAMPALEAR